MKQKEDARWKPYTLKEELKQNQTITLQSSLLAETVLTAVLCAWWEYRTMEGFED